MSKPTTTKRAAPAAAQRLDMARARIVRHAMLLDDDALGALVAKAKELLAAERARH